MSQPLPGCSVTGHRDHWGARGPPVPAPSLGLSTPWGAQLPPGMLLGLPIPGWMSPTWGMKQTRLVPAPAPVWQAESRAAPMPPLLPTLPFPRQEQGQLPQVQVGWPCPDPLASSRVLPPPQRALQTGPWQKARFPPCCLCAGGGVGWRNMSSGEETSPWDTPVGGRGWQRCWLMPASTPSRAATHQPPRAPEPPPKAPIPSPGGCRFVPWQGMERAGGSVPGHGMAGLSSGSVPPGLASPARLGRAPKALTPAEDASDASEAVW